MDIVHILSQVESPFTDEEMEKPYVNDLRSRMFSLSSRGERFVDGNNSWDIIG